MERDDLNDTAPDIRIGDRWAGVSRSDEATVTGVQWLLVRGHVRPLIVFRVGDVVDSMTGPMAFTMGQLIHRGDGPSWREMNPPAPPREIIDNGGNPLANLVASGLVSMAPAKEPR